jgi:hypothetical protein
MLDYAAIIYIHVYQDVFQCVDLYILEKGATINLD